MILSSRAQNISSSPTLAIGAKVGELRSQGIDVLNFGNGEPDFHTPDNVKMAGIKAITDNITKYTPAAGIPRLKEAICRKFKEDNNIQYKAENIIVSTGAKQTLINAIIALIEPGDEALIPVPCWVSYPEQIKLMGGKPVFVETDPEDGFRLNIQNIIDKITSKTKLIILNTPNNPTGTVFSRQELEQLAEVAVKNQIYVLSDEVYEKFLYDGAEHISIASLNDEIKDLTVVINGVSKSYAMTGWRLGFSAAPVKITSAMNKIQGHTTSNANSVAQMAALEALTGSQESVVKMCNEFEKRRAYIVDVLDEIEGITCSSPEGAFYAFPNIQSFFGKKYKNYQISNSFDMVVYLLEEANIAVVHGSAFNLEGYLRICFASSMEDIKEGMARFKKALDKLN